MVGSGPPPAADAIGGGGVHAACAGGGRGRGDYPPNARAPQRSASGRGRAGTSGGATTFHLPRSGGGRLGRRVLNSNTHLHRPSTSHRIFYKVYIHVIKCLSEVRHAQETLVLSLRVVPRRLGTRCACVCCVWAACATGGGHSGIAARQPRPTLPHGIDGTAAARPGRHAAAATTAAAGVEVVGGGQAGWWRHALRGRRARWYSFTPPGRRGTASTWGGTSTRMRSFSATAGRRTCGFTLTRYGGDGPQRHAGWAARGVGGGGEGGRSGG